MRKHALAGLGALAAVLALIAVAVALTGSAVVAPPLTNAALASPASQLEAAKKADAAAASGVKSAEANLAAQKATKAATGEVVAALEVAEPPPAQSAQLDGVNVWPLNKGSDTEHEHEALLAAEHHSTLVRISTLWEALEPSKGTLSSEWLAHLDKQVNTAAAHGEKAILTVSTTPKWANGGGAWYVAPSNPADYGAFCAKLAQRYGPKVLIEVWNEPNGGSSPLVAPSGKTPEQAYGEMAKAAIVAINGQVPILVGALFYTDVEWLKRALAAGGVTLQNGVVEVSFHPYADGNPPGEGTASSTFHSFKGGIEKLHAAFPNSRLWPTEFGYKVGEAGMSEATRAQRIKESFSIARSLSYVAGATVYELRSKSDLFGLVDGSFAASPSLTAFTEALS